MLLVFLTLDYLFEESSWSGLRLTAIELGLDYNIVIFCILSKG
jgi:hypothetical protein